MNHNLNVLFIDDSQSDIKIIASEFEKQGFDIKYDCVSGYNELLMKLSSNYYDLAISKYELSIISYSDVLSILSEMNLEIPLLVISDSGNEDDMISCIKEGCRDCLIKSDMSRLKLVVTRILCETDRLRRVKERGWLPANHQEYFNATLESMADGLIATDLEGKVTFINNMAMNIMMLQQKDLSGVPVEQVLILVNISGENQTRQIIDKVMKTGYSAGLQKDTVLITCSGERRYASASISPVRNLNGVIIGAVIVLRDITRLRSLEKILEKEKDNLAAIFEAVPVGLIMLDRNLTVRRVNSAMSDLMGDEAENMIDKRIGGSLCCINGVQESAGCGFSKACESCSLCMIISDVYVTGTGVYGKEIRLSRLVEGRKEDLWLRISSVPISINGIEQVILSVDDITMNKRVEEALARSRDFYLTLFENFPALIWRSGLDGKCDYFNKSWLKFTGRTMEEELGDGWVSGVHPDDMDMCFKTYTAAFNARESFEMEYRLRRHDGEYRWIYDAGRPFYDTEGCFLGYIGSCYDITENKRLRQNLVKRNVELNNALSKLKETQIQLVQHEKLAAIGHLAAGVAHEINNPLGFIMSNVEVLEKYSLRIKEAAEAFCGLRDILEADGISEAGQILAEIDTLTKRHKLDMITRDLKPLLDDTYDGLDRIRKIVISLRNFSRIDDQEEPADYDLNEGIENTIMVANNEIKYHVDVIKKLGNIPPVRISGNNINQVLLNLIINSVHAIEEKNDGKRGLIIISTYLEKGYVCCAIEDNGIGIPEENMNKIFNPFFTTKPVGKGTGLGLSISYDIIVNKHGGKMLVQSTPGKGTIFTVKLPILKKDEYKESYENEE